MKAGLYIGIAWILSVAVAYGLGWWSGIKSGTQVAATAVQSGFPFVMIVLAIVAIGAAVAAYRARGYFNRRNTV